MHGIVYSVTAITIDLLQHLNTCDVYLFTFRGFSHSVGKQHMLYVWMCLKLIRSLTMQGLSVQGWIYVYFAKVDSGSEGIVLREYFPRKWMSYFLECWNCDVMIKLAQDARTKIIFFSYMHNKTGYADLLKEYFPVKHSRYPLRYNLKKAICGIYRCMVRLTYRSPGKFLVILNVIQLRYAVDTFMLCVVVYVHYVAVFATILY